MQALMQSKGHIARHWRQRAFFESVKTSEGNIMPSGSKRVTLSLPLYSEAATIPGPHESLIETFCMRNELFDHQLLRTIHRHVESSPGASFRSGEYRRAPPSFDSGFGAWLRWSSEHTGRGRCHRVRKFI